jgi:transporter family-2 protein
VIVLVLVAIGAGLLLPVQAGVNAQLRLGVGGPLPAALVSFVVGSVGLAAVLAALRVPVALGRAGSVPWWQWTGGLLGATYVASSIVLAPRLGAATLIASTVAGQMLASLVLDRFGWIGFHPHPLTVPRLVGALLVVAGVVLVQR